MQKRNTFKTDKKDNKFNIRNAMSCLALHSLLRSTTRCLRHGHVIVEYDEQGWCKEESEQEHSSCMTPSIFHRNQVGEGVSQKGKDKREHPATKFRMKNTSAQYTTQVPGIANCSCQNFSSLFICLPLLTMKQTLVSHDS